MMKKVAVFLVAVAFPAVSGPSANLCIPPLCLPDPPHLIVPGPVELPSLPSLPLPPVLPPPTVPAPPPSCTTFTVGMKVLVISADGQESTLGAIREGLDYHS